MFHRDTYPRLCLFLRIVHDIEPSVWFGRSPHPQAAHKPHRYRHRVSSTVTMNPASIKTFQKRETALPLGRLKPELGKSLKGMRLILQG